MNWDDVRVFVAVAGCKSVSKAAHALRVTPGMVSRRLDELESALDVSLFIRTSTGVTLTAAGEDMLDRALSMQRFADSIEDVDLSPHILGNELAVQLKVFGILDVSVHIQQLKSNLWGTLANSGKFATDDHIVTL